MHAIGAGIFLAEVQQTSDITYRIYDFNRKDTNGKERELHTELALSAINFEDDKDFRTQYTEEFNKRSELIKCPYFTTNHSASYQGLWNATLLPGLLCYLYMT